MPAHAESHAAPEAPASGTARRRLVVLSFSTEFGAHVRVHPADELPPLPKAVFSAEQDAYEHVEFTSADAMLESWPRVKGMARRNELPGFDPEERQSEEDLMDEIAERFVRDMTDLTVRAKPRAHPLQGVVVATVNYHLIS